MNDCDLVDGLPTGLAVLDRNLTVSRWNQWMVLHSGRDAREVVGRPVTEIYPEIDTAAFRRAFDSVITFGSVMYLSQRLHHYLFPFAADPVYRPELSMMQQSCTLSAVRDERAIVGVAIMVSDVSDRVVMERRLRQANLRDSLTGSYNRRFLNARLPEEIERHRRTGRPLTLLLLDLDHFKDINDRFGHATGDLALQRFAQAVTRHLRGIDQFARYGGEEFVCLLPETDIDGALSLAERIRSGIEHDGSGERAGGRPGLTVSIGVAELEPQQDSPESLLTRADQAMYRAKQNGRNRVELAQLPGTN